MTTTLGRLVTWELRRATEAAALAAAELSGSGDPRGADRAAVDAMRAALSSAELDAIIVSGEGEKDEAPMLFNGERVGNGGSPKLDLAVDPLEGTKLLAAGSPNAIAVVAGGERGSMWSPGPSFYMEKLVVGDAARDAIDITASTGENLSRVAKALGRVVRELCVFVLDKPRHRDLIAEIRSAGARVHLASDGDVMGALAAAFPQKGIDMLMGVGGTPEGIIAACALKALGAEMHCRLAPQSEDEGERVFAAGLDPACVLTLDELVTSKSTFFVATGVTSGDFLNGVELNQGGATTSSLIIDGSNGQHHFVTTVRPVGGVA